MKYLIALILFFSFNSFAAQELPNYGWYAGLTAGSAADTGEKNEQLKGASGGFLFGYRWYNWALELNYDSFKLSSKGGLSEYHYGTQLYIDKAELKGSSTSLTLKGFWLRYIMFGLGLGVFSAEHDFKFHDPANPTSRFAFEGDEGYSMVFSQIGVVLPLYRHLDLRVFYEVRNFTGITPEISVGNTYQPQLSGTIKQFAAQAIYYFN